MSDLITMPEQQLTRAEPVSVESMVLHAIDRGVDPAALKELVLLQEHVLAKRAEQSFNTAMQAFKANPPKIAHNKYVDGGQAQYSYTDLPGLLDALDPALQAHGLSYTFDSVMDAETMTVKCTIHHVDGHSRSASFTCKISGTRAMSAAQMAGSAITFGRRYSLQMALGICTDTDDDGRSAPPPHDNPAQNGDAPKSQPRSKRIEEGELKILLNAWKRKQKSVEGSESREALVNWAAAVCSLECNAETVTKVSTWNKDAFNAGMADLKGFT